MKRRVPLVLLAPAGLLALYLVLPFIAGLQQADSADWAGADIAALLRACEISALSASVASALIALGGIPLGYWLARTPGRFARILGFVVQLPLALPPLSSGILLLFLVGPFTPLAQFAGDVTDTFWGIVIAQTFVAAPFLIIAARAGFGAVDPVLEDVAATLGHKPLPRFLLVSLPLAWPTLLAGWLLSWLRAFGEFGATVMLAYHPYSLPVYTYVAFGSRGLPAMMPVLLPTLAVAIIVMMISTGWQPRPATVRRPLRTALSLSPDDRSASEWGLSVPGLELRIAFRFQARRGSFTLDTAWQPRTRRLAILGPSGSGKSLTLRLLAGLEAPFEGFLRIGGDDLTHLPPEARGIAYVPQNYGLFPNRRVRQQLLFPVGAVPAEVDAWVTRLGLAGLQDRVPAELSLGQQQRVALARALIRPARLVLLDEPFSALDAPLRERLRRELRDMQHEIAATTVIVTHDPEEAMLLADEILIMDQGQVLQAGAVRDVAARPASPDVAGLLGAEMTSLGTISSQNRIAIGQGVYLATRALDIPPGTPIRWTVRREFVRVGTTGAYEAYIEDCACIGNAEELVIRIGDARLRALSEPGNELQSGRCRVDISPAAVLAWPALPDAVDVGVLNDRG